MSLHPEQIEHINIVNWFNYEYPDLADDLHHFANERRCSVQQGRTLKRMGVKKGVADFFLAIPLNGKAGLWLELKVGRGKPSEEQINFGMRKMMRHYEFAFAWGAEQAKETIKTYLSEYQSKRDGVIQISYT